MRDQQLAAEVIDGRLVVSIGVDALAKLIVEGEDWSQHAATVEDADAFAAAIGRVLVEDEGDQQSELRFALDRAADWVVEEGLDGNGIG